VVAQAAVRLVAVAQARAVVLAQDGVLAQVAAAVVDAVAQGDPTVVIASAVPVAASVVLVAVPVAPEPCVATALRPRRQRRTSAVSRSRAARPCANC
jgi:hypothetical protein